MTGPTSDPGSLAGPRPDPDLVECLVVVVPELTSLAAVAEALGEMVASATIRILDLVCVTREADEGSLKVVELEEVESLALLETVDGYVGGLLSSRDIESASLAIESGSSAIVLLVEDQWAEGLAAAARQAGGRVWGGERVASSRVVEAVLDPQSAEPTPPRGKPGGH